MILENNKVLNIMARKTTKPETELVPVMNEFSLIHAKGRSATVMAYIFCGMFAVILWRLFH